MENETKGKILAWYKTRGKRLDVNILGPGKGEGKSWDEEGNESKENIGLITNEFLTKELAPKFNEMNKWFQKVDSLFIWE